MSAVLALANAHAREHPGDVARMAEGAPPDALAELLTALEPEIGASLVARIVPLAGAQALGCMSSQAAASIVAHLDPPRVAPLLRTMDSGRCDALLAELPRPALEAVRRLLGYPANQAAGRIDPRAPAVSRNSTAEQALALVRAAGGAALHYVYLIDDEHHLVGVVSMRELMMADPNTALGQIMTGDPERLRADDPLTAVVAHPGWKRRHALPVVDGSNRYLGVIRYSAFRRIETELGMTAAGSSAVRTSAALAELFFLGTTAMGRLAEVAVLGASTKAELRDG